MAYLGTKPANQVIDSTLIADGTITPSDLSTGKPVWDTSGNVGIGTSSPQSPLNVSYSNSSRADCLRLTNTNTGGYGPWINFYGDYSSGYSFAKIGAENESTGGSLRFHTADTSKVSQERMRIDNSGRVTMPYQPAFHATRDTAYNANGTVVVFPDVSVNIGSGYNSSNGRFTAPVAGTYIILVSFFTNITNAPIDFRITVNGGAVGGNATTGTTSVARDCHAYIIRTVSANDYIEVISQGFGMNIPGGLGIFQTFSGHLIG